MMNYRVPYGAHTKEYEFLLNGLVSTRSIQLKPLESYEVEFDCDFEEAKRKLQSALVRLVKNGSLCTYELTSLEEEGVKAKIYVDGTSDPQILLSVCKQRRDPVQARNATPSRSGLENLLDAVVSVALEGVEADLKKVGLEGIEVDRRNARTVLDSEQRFVLYLDYTRPLPTVAEKILEELKIQRFDDMRRNKMLKSKALEVASQFVGREVLVPYGRRRVRGVIAEVEDVFVGSKEIEYRGEKVTLDKYWETRDVGVDSNEYPVFNVEIRDTLLSYPPSLIMLIGAREPDPLEDRFTIIEQLLKIVGSQVEELLRRLGLGDVRFEPIKVGRGYVHLMPPFYSSDEEKRVIEEITGVEAQKATVRLMYKDQNGKPACRSFSPLYAFDSANLRPYAEGQEINLVVIYPSKLSQDDISEFVNELVEGFSKLNFGSIKVKSLKTYEYYQGKLIKSRDSLGHAVAEVARNVLKDKDLMLVVLPEKVRSYYVRAKAEASKEGCHTQLVLAPVVESILKELRRGEGKEKWARAKLANICAGIYAEYLIQRKKSGGKLVGPLTWKLCEPADGRGRSVYVGLDVSTAKGVEGAAFIMFDPYGELLGAHFIPLKAETISKEDYEEIFERIIRTAREQGYEQIERVVILRDGPLRTQKELDGCLKAFDEVQKQLEYRLSLDYISVIKKNNIRVFMRDGGSTVRNPVQGTHFYMYKHYHLGMSVHDVIVVSSKPKARKNVEVSGKPLVLRIYDPRDGRKVDESYAMQVAEEYLKLTRLDFWNLETGAHKLALPVNMADTLAYMMALGIQLRES
jgi:hypothetical protein